MFGVINLVGVGRHVEPVRLGSQGQVESFMFDGVERSSGLTLVGLAMYVQSVG